MAQGESRSKRPVFGTYTRLSVLSGVFAFAATRFAPEYAWKGSLVRTAALALFAESCLYVLYKIILYPKLLSPLRHLPGPKDGSFFMGQGFRILREPTGRPMREWIKIPNDGLIRYLGIFNGERLLLTNPKALSEVLVTKSYDFVKPNEVVVALQRLLGDGILTSEGDLHRFQRKNLSPAFSFRHVKELYPKFWAKAAEMADVVSEESRASLESPEATKARYEKNAHHFESDFASEEWAADEKLTKSPPSIKDITGVISRTTLDIIGVAGMGHDFGSLKDPSNPLASEYQKVFQPSTNGLILALLSIFFPAWLLPWIPIQRNAELDKAKDVSRKATLDLIAKKRAQNTPEHDILSVAIDSKAFTDENLVDQALTFLAAGHETTATALTWALYHLSMHPKLQAQLRHEVRTNLPSPKSGISSAADVPSAHDIDTLPLLNAFCNEVLRYYAPVPMTFRIAYHDTVIQDIAVPAGTRIILCPAAINWDENLWGSDASQFSVERWLAPGQGNSGGAKSNYANLTFLHGPRSCIGRDFSKSEFAVLTAVLAGKLEFIAIEPERQYNIRGATAKPVGGMTLAVRSIGGW